MPWKRYLYVFKAEVSKIRRNQKEGVKREMWSIKLRYRKQWSSFEIIILGCSSTDFDDEYPAIEQVRLINGDWVNKEYLKCNAFDFISILIRNAKGRIYKVLEMELS